MKTNEQYKKDLLANNIRVYPLDNYKGALHKILHKCICNNEWYAYPNNVIKGAQCGCKIKKTHNQYLIDLDNKNIKVIPLEKYIDKKTKILHKCTCGNTWMINPNTVLKGTQCHSKGGLFTNDMYIKKLKDNKIDIIPLEIYKGINNRILHKCICGNTWMVTPYSVLKDNKCGCANDISINYLDRLKEKSIKVIPLERVKSSQDKILHRCICGNEWKSTPSNILQGHLCGCSKNYSLRGEDFYKGKSTILYYIKISGLWKIGITLFNKNIEYSLRKRFSKDYDLIENIIKTEIFEDGSIAFNLEQQILNYNWDKKYKGPRVLISGNTELFKEDINEDI